MHTGRRSTTVRTGPLRRLAVVAVTAAALSAGLVAPPASAAPADRWVAPLGDAGRSGTNPGETALVAASAPRTALAWSTPTRSVTSEAPVVVDGVALRVVYGMNAFQGSRLTATSLTDGSTVWSAALPDGARYGRGLSVSGSSLVVPYEGDRRPGGVLVLDLRTRTVAWSQPLPPTSVFPWMGNAQASWAGTDGQRVFVQGGDTAVATYRLSDGAPLWARAITVNPVNGTPDAPTGVAVGSGSLYLGGTSSLTVLDSATGQQSWTSSVPGQPVVSGNRVFTGSSGAVTALPAAGCGASTCAPLWRTSFPVGGHDVPVVSGVDGDTLFVTSNGDQQGTVTRLSTATGARQWSVVVGRFVTGLVRAGDLVWVNDDYATATGQLAQRIVAFSTTATTATPVQTIALPAERSGYPQQLAVAGGTLFQQLNGGALVGYRAGAVGPAPAGATVALDTFRRTTGTGLGTADTGGPWTATAGASRMSVAPGAAAVALVPGAAARAHLAGVSRATVDVSATLSLTAAPTGGGVSTYLVARRTGTDQEYRLRARFAADGTLRLAVTAVSGSPSERVIGAEVVVAGVRPTAGTPVNLRLQVTGQGTTTLSARAWTGSTEPSTWALTRTDGTAALQPPGAVGLGAYLSGSATAPVTVRVSAFRAVSAG